MIQQDKDAHFKEVKTIMNWQLDGIKPYATIAEWEQIFMPLYDKLIAEKSFGKSLEIFLAFNQALEEHGLGNLAKTFVRHQLAKEAVEKPINLSEEVI